VSILYNPPKIISAYHDLSSLVSDIGSIAKEIKRAFTSQVTIPGDTRAYSWCLQWLQEHTNLSRNKDVVLKKNRYGKDHFIPTNKPFHFTYNDKMLSVRMEKTEDTSGWGSGFREILIFTCLGKNNQPILDLISEAECIYKKEEGAYNAFGGHNEEGEWRRWSYRSKRKRSTVILPEKQMSGLMSDIEVFLGAKERYADLGIPWRRGYLLFGPPGTGKSSVVPVIASDFDLDVYVVQVADLTDTTLAAAMSGIQQKSIILMEDIDRALASDKKTLTQSGLFNAIDGASAAEGVILIMTTNNRDQLDSALIRPGRIDYEVGFGSLGFEEATRMYLKFFPGKVAEAKEFAKRAVAEKMTPADAQGELLIDYDIMENLPLTGS